MTEKELNETIATINNDQNDTPQGKQKRVDFVKGIYATDQQRLADEAKKQQESVEASLKGSLKKAYMSNPAATEEDFEKDYPQLKSDYLRNNALQKEGQARAAASESIRSAF